MKATKIFALSLLLSTPSLAQGTLTITEAWTTPSLTDDATIAVFLTAANESNRAVNITGAHSSLAESAMLHGTQTTADGMMRMHHLMQAEVPAHGKLVFKPGDAHVMLMGVHGRLKAGNSFPLTLELGRDGAVTTTVEVRPLAAKLQEKMEAEAAAAREKPAEPTPFNERLKRRKGIK
jgi:periplasmic copper chaperone A